MIKLKEGQKILDENGNIYLTEKDDILKESADSLSWSKELYGKKATIFDYLDINQEFVFPNSTEINVKINKTKYKDSNGRIFITGKGSSVIPL